MKPAPAEIPNGSDNHDTLFAVDLASHQCLLMLDAVDRLAASSEALFHG